MKPINVGSHFAYQNRVLTQLHKYYPDAVTKKLLLDSAHDAMPYYDYSKANGITPFKNLKRKCGRPPVYKDDVTINKDGIPLCPKGLPMKPAAVKPKKAWFKYRCPKITCKGVTVQCTCEAPCSAAKYGRNVHFFLKTIQDRLTIHLVIVLNGSWNIMQEHLQSAVTNTKKLSINLKTADTVHQ